MVAGDQHLRAPAQRLNRDISLNSRLQVRVLPGHQKPQVRWHVFLALLALRSLAWLVGYRRLQMRYERRADILLGLVQLACALICLNSLNQTKA
jgi:hypothetical protein